MTDQQDLRARLLARAEDLSDLDLMDRGTASLLREAAAQLGRVEIPQLPAGVPELSAIGQLIATQDNRITGQPIFIVQQKRRIVGVDDDFAEGHLWYDPIGVESYDETGKAERDAQRAEDGSRPIPWQRGGYIDTWEFVTACFTEQGCKDYIASDGHNLREPRIYAAGSFRNEEWRTVRKFLLSLAATPQPDSAAPGGGENAPLDAVYAKFEAMDNQDVPLEQYPQAAVNALAHAGWAIVPCCLPFELLGESARSGMMETGNPKHVWDYLISKTRLYPAPITTPIAAAIKPEQVDTEARARELLAAEYERMGYKALVTGVREFPFEALSDGDEAALLAIIAALSAPKQVGGLPDAVLLDRGFQIKDGVVTPTLLFGFNPDDWAARDRFAAMINTSPQAAPVPVEGDGRRFRGVGHLEETGYIDPPSQPAVELERNEAAKLAKGLRESAIAMRALHGGIYAKWNDRADECDKAAALIDGAKAGRG